MRRGVAVALALLAMGSAGARSADGAEPAGASTITVPWCGTSDSPHVADLGARGLSIKSRCPTDGPCDDPSVRDSTRVVPITIPIIAHVIRTHDGSCDLSPAAVQQQIESLNEYFARNATGFHFELAAVRIHEDDALAVLPACDSATTCSRAERAIDLTFALYAESPESYCNIYFSCLATGRWGGLAGLGTLPWFPDATGATGGAWVNTWEIGLRPEVLPHEMGHVLGLWHVHRGVSEVTSCSAPCYEAAHDPEADRRGDFAADTPATPVNYTCEDPTRLDCSGRPYAPTLLDNLMGYGPPECAAALTPQQIRRMQCWARARLQGWMGAEEPRASLALRVIPNPATTGVNLAFEVVEAGRVRLEVFDLLGRLVARVLDEDRTAGTHRIWWSGATGAGRTIRPGMYLARVSCAGRTGHVTFAWRP